MEGIKIIYSVCFYHDRKLFENLKIHCEVIKKFNLDVKLVINIMTDKNSNFFDSIQKEVIEKIKEFGIDCYTTISFNWGGTILGLYNTYEFLKSKNMTKCYICHFEEDFYATNKDFIPKSMELLFSKDNIAYVGESTELLNKETGEGVAKETGNRQNKIIKNSNYEYWTDGGYYFSSYQKLDEIYNKIGIFHKGDPTKKYDHGLDGIDLGEVGFPTLLYNNGYKLKCLHRNVFFIP